MQKKSMWVNGQRPPVKLPRLRVGARNDGEKPAYGASLFLDTAHGESLGAVAATSRVDVRRVEVQYSRVGGISEWICRPRVTIRGRATQCATCKDAISRSWVP